MARARLIKPGFFTNDMLAEVEPLGRLLFAGLWTIADREGRLEDRPKRIKAEVLPFDNADVDALLGQLEQQGFITRYTVAGYKLIQISAFLKHQSPHPREVASRLPAMVSAAVDELAASGQPLAAVRSMDIKPPSEPCLGGDEPSTGPSVAVPIAGSSGSSVAVAVAEAAEPGDAAAAADPEIDEAVGRLCRVWESATGTTVTRMLGDFFATNLEGLPEAWIADAIQETGAAGAKSMRYTAAILDRWKTEGRGVAPVVSENPFKKSAEFLTAARERSK